MYTGKQGDYYWLEDDTSSISMALEKAPDILVGRYLTVTSFDSGPLHISDEEKMAGWHEDGMVAHSPRLTSCDVPYDDSYDEWYVFDEERALGEIEVFVNYVDFSLFDPRYLLEELKQGDDTEAIEEYIERKCTLQARFWNQLVQIAPRTFISCGHQLVIATLDVSVIRRLSDAKLRSN